MHGNRMADALIEAAGGDDLLRTLIDQSQDLIAAIDEDYRYLVLNEACAAELERVFGVVVRPGDCLLDVLDGYPDQLAWARAAWGRALAGESFIAVYEPRLPVRDARVYESRYGAFKLANGRRGAFHITRDITERVRAERAVQRVNRKLSTTVKVRTRELEETALALASQRERLGAALDVSASGTFSWDSDTDVLYCDERLQQLLDLKPQHGPASLHTLLQVIHPDDRTALWEAFERSGACGEALSMRFRVQRQDGEPRWIHAVAARYPRPNLPAQVIGACTDITDRTAAERQLAEREAQLRVLADSMPVIVWIRDAEGRLEYINKRWCEYTGLNREETLQRQVEELVHPDDLPRVRAAVFRAHRSGAEFESEYRLYSPRRKDYRWHLVRATPERNDVGRIVRWHGTATDIAEQVRTRARLEAVQEALQRSNVELADSLAQLGGVIDSMTEGLVICDAAGNLLAMNPAARRLHGVPAEADLRSTEENSRYRFGILDIDGDPLPFEDSPIGRVLRGERFSGYEVQVRRQDNGELWIASYGGAPVHDQGGAIRYTIVTVRDVTEEKAREKALKGALDARERFLSVAAHELRTPLTTLAMQLQMARRKVNVETGRAPSPEELVKTLDVSNRQVKRLARLVDDLLDVTRSTKGGLSFNFEPCDLAELAVEVAAQFRSVLEANGCTLDLACAPDVVGTWDRSRLEQVISNLLGNLIRYAPGSAASIRVKRSGDAAVLIVSDNGPGIAAEEQAKVFERFERGHAGEVAGGLGLGLYLVRQIVIGHGGTIELDSALGAGCRFNIRLPHHPPADLAAE